MNVSYLFFITFLFALCLFVKSQSGRPKYIWRRFGITEDIKNIEKVLGEKQKEEREKSMMAKLKDAFSEKQKAYDDEMEEKRRRIYKFYLNPLAGSTSILSDLYNRFK